MKVRRIAPKQQFRQKRVAAYARVSTLKEEQEESFETQVAYYTNLIENNADWEFAGIFSDQGFSGVSAEKRPGFQKMIKSADNGNIDLILVKSISRFARNAIEAQEYLRMLKNLNVEVRFEREHLSSFDQTAEMTFNMLAAMAQEESHAISRRMRWSLDKRAEKGERKIARVFGYDVKNGELMPNRDARVVKEIFKLYSEGYSASEISDILAKKHGTVISYSTVTKMLKNEIYVGDRHIQKNAPQNYITKKPDDTVSYDSYYVQDNHEGIISRELWEKVQERISGPRRHRNSHFMYTEYYLLTERLPEIKEWYGSYQFGVTEMYNPWSILKYIESAINGDNSSCVPYWISTSSNIIIKDLIEKANPTTKKMVKNLLHGGSVKVPIYENFANADIGVNKDLIWSILLYTGYLKQVKAELINNSVYSTMIIPNREVMSIYEITVQNWFEESVNKEGRTLLLAAVLSEDPAAVQNEINKWLAKSISYHDAFESFYHGFMAGLLVGSETYDVKSNRENGEGRTDLTICELQTRSVAFVIEIKIAEEFRQLDEKCDEAIAQIRRNKYDKQLTDDCYKRVVRYGVAFYKKACKVKMDAEPV